MADIANAQPIVSALAGGALRVVPELFNFFNRRGERKHELALGQQQMELLKLQSSTHLSEIAATSEAAQTAAALAALTESIKAQAAPTGVKWVDAMSALVRPVWTFLILLSWETVKVVNTGVALYRGMEWTSAQALLWNADDTSMLSTLMTFWFLDRVIRKAK